MDRHTHGEWARETHTISFTDWFLTSSVRMCARRDYVFTSTVWFIGLHKPTPSPCNTLLKHARTLHMHARGQKNAVSGSSAVKSVIKKMKWGNAPIHLLCIHVNKSTLICIQTQSLFAVRRVYCCRCVLNIVMLILVLHKDAQRESYEFFAHRWSQWETNIKTLISHNFLPLIIALVPFFALLVHQKTWICNSFIDVIQWCAQ